MLFREDCRTLSVGSRVLVRQSHRAPNSGHAGTIVNVEAGDNKGAYLVRFEDGTQFRYKTDEIEPSPSREHHNRNQFFGRIMKSYFQLLLTLLFAVTLVSACGPAPNPKLQAKSEPEADKASPAVQPVQAEEQPRRSVPVVEEPQPKPEPRVVPQPKPAAAAKPAPAKSAPVAVARPADRKPAPAPSAPAEDKPLADSRSMTLPKPIDNTIAAPVPPSEDEVRPARVEPPPPPAPKRVSVPSGTILAVRMIDSVDSETATVGETFKASLDAPVVLDNETVFPKGAEVYVKLSKVQAAGRVSGRSELQLELDRIYLGSRSYTLESSKYVSTGASQAGKTAKSAGLGAAIGAAIGAVTGGGKGAVIGGATGAGAGAGVEAVRKGEQVRVDSETRLEFRLEDSVDVTLQSSSSTSSQRNNPSGPVRFGTRQ